LRSLPLASLASSQFAAGSAKQFPSTVHGNAVRPQYCPLRAFPRIVAFARTRRRRRHGKDQGRASLLARVFPPEAVHGVPNEHGRNIQRVRSFPAVAGMYYCMALSPYPGGPYEEMFAVVA